MDHERMARELARVKINELQKEARSYSIIHQARTRRISRLGYAYLAVVWSIIGFLLFKGVAACTRLL